MNFKTILATSVTAVAISAPLALAQAQDGSFALEEIVVTAERREGGLQQTPLAVTALSALQLERQQVTETLDLVRSVPNFVAKNNVNLGASNSYFLRGIGNTESIATFDVPVGTYVDEVYVARQNANNIELVEVERIEVLRGPQGTLFGRNTTGGAISIITKKPDEEFEAKGEIGYGRFDEFRVKGSVNVPINDRFLTKTSAYYISDDGFFKSLNTDEKYNGQESAGVRGAVRLLPSDNITWDMSADWSTTDHLQIGGAVDATIQETVVNNDAFLSGDIFTGFRRTLNCKDGDTPQEWAANECTANEVEGYNLYSNINFEMEMFDVALITGYRNLDHNFSTDLLDNSPQYTFGLSEYELANEGNHNQFSQEIKVTGSLMDDRLSYVTGVFYMKEDNRTFFTDIISIAPVLEDVPSADRDLENDTESFAWYAQADYEVIDDLIFTAGIRWTDEKKLVRLDFNNGQFSHLDIPGPDQFTTVKWTPKFGLQYRFSDNAMGYVSATRGFKSGGWNARATTANTFRPFTEETVWSYEAGVRTEWFDNRFRLNMTVYDANYDDIQIATILPGTSDFITENPGNSQNQGLEIETQLLVMEGLTVFANAGFQDGKYKTLSQRALDSGFTLNTVPVQTPDYTFQAGFNYNVPLQSGDQINVNADVQATDDYFMGNQNGPETRILSYETVNASIGYEAEDGTWGLTLGCKNCFDHEYWHTHLFNVRFPADPMRWSLRLKFAYN